jgi:hypothetical protein
MKKHLYIVLFCILSIPIFAQTTYFNKIIDPQPFNGANNVISMITKRYIYLYLGRQSYLIQAGNKTNLMLHLDLAGNIKNKKLISVPHHWLSAVPINSLIDDGTGLVAIGAVIDTNNHGRAYMIKTDYNLDTLWTRAYPHPDATTIPVPPTGSYSYCHLMAVRSTPDGGYIAAGRYNPGYLASYTLRTFLLKTDSLGNKEWLKTYPGYDRTWSLEVTQDNGFAFIATGGALRLVVTDSLGTVTRETTAPLPPPYEKIMTASSVKQFANGDFAMACLYAKREPAPNSFFWGIYLLRINPAGEIVKRWTKTYRPFLSVECLPFHNWLEMHILPDQSIVFMGNALVKAPELHHNAQFKGFLMKLNPSGDSLWARHYNYGKWEDWSQFYSMIPTDDGGFLAGGLHMNFDVTTIDNASIWLVKVDSMGCETPGCHLVSSIENPAQQHGDMTLYPNPFSHELNIALPESPAGATATLYDMQGRIMQQTRIPEFLHTEHYTLQTHYLPPGVYICCW